MNCWSVSTGASFGTVEPYVVATESKIGCLKYAVCIIPRNDIDKNEYQNAALIALVPEMKKAILDAANESHECLTPGDGCVVCVARKIKGI